MDLCLSSTAQDAALNAVSKLRGYGLLAYSVMENTSTSGVFLGFEDAASVVFDGIHAACDELASILNGGHVAVTEEE